MTSQQDEIIVGSEQPAGAAEALIEVEHRPAQAPAHQQLTVDQFDQCSAVRGGPEQGIEVFDIGRDIFSQPEARYRRLQQAGAAAATAGTRAALFDGGQQRARLIDGKGVPYQRASGP